MHNLALEQESTQVQNIKKAAGWPRQRSLQHQIASCEVHFCADFFSVLHANQHNEQQHSAAATHLEDSARHCGVDIHRFLREI